MKKWILSLPVFMIAFTACSHSSTPTNAQQAQQDRVIVEEVRKVVYQNPSLTPNARNIEVISEEGVVTLRGQVTDANEAGAIENSIKNVPGVKKVKNELKTRN